MSINLLAPIIIGAIFLVTLSNTLYGGDAGDLLSAILTKGHAHPPGYSLYTLLGIIFNKISIALMPAGKVTLISALATIASLILLFYIIKEISSPHLYHKILNLITIFAVGFNYIVWLYAIIPELFPLNTLIILSIFYSMLKFYKTGKSRYLYLLTFFIGLGITHHHTFLLVLPSIFYLIIKAKNKLKLSKKIIFKTVFIFLIAILPLSYLVYVSKSQSEFQWAQADTVGGFFELITRQMYGSFVPGSFISNLAYHRLLQLKVVFNYSLIDFTLLGAIFFLLGLVTIFRFKQKLDINILTAVFINIFFFGPFYFFYANFPLTDKFLFATIERFLHIYYFFFSLIVYFGLYFLVKLLHDKVVKNLVKNETLRRTASTLILVILFLYPASLFSRNYKYIKSLKNDRTAENLGNDTLNNAQKRSIIFLTKDTQLFDTQYIYYAYPRIRDQKILIHLSKIARSYYPKLLHKYYPALKIKTEKDGSLKLSNFVLDNKAKFNIYSNDIIPLATLTEYSWIPQGVLFKLEEKGKVDINESLRNLESFWKNSLNKNLTSEVRNNKNKFKNSFLWEVLRTYSDGRVNTAAYLLDHNLADESLAHIESVKTLNPDDNDYYYLLSKYYEKKNQCKEAEETIEKAIEKSLDALFLQQLAYIGRNCYKTEPDMKRIDNKLKSYTNKLNIPINRF